MAAAGLYDLCREFLEACAEACTIAPAGAIDRAYVSPGMPAFDCCPQLTVHAGGPQQADTAPLAPPLQPGHREQTTQALILVQMTATVIRCSPTLELDGSPTMPDPALLDASAAETLGDVWTIWNHLATLKRTDALWGPKTREVFFDAAIPVMTSGGCAGWQIPVRVQLDGYRTSV